MVHSRSSCLLVLLVLLSSCYYNKRMVYLQQPGISSVVPTVVPNHKVIYQVQTSDVLSVRIKSATNTDLTEIFNLAPSFASAYIVPGSLFLQGYSVGEDGNITLPIIGNISVRGLTIDEIRIKIEKEAQRYLNNATVIVNLISFKVTVLGEVNSPGYHYIYNNQATVLEALGLAGDITRLGNRKNVKLIRQKGGNSEVILLDLTDANLLRSPYFFLMPNDVLYVEPARATVSRSNLDLLNLLFSAATTTVLILSYINSQ